MVEKKTGAELDQCKADQKTLCREKGHPHFAPLSGVCYACGKSVYQNYELESGSVSNGLDGKALVTGCPHCHRSFCD